MKKAFLPASYYQLAVPASLLAFALSLCCSASAQNLLKNGDFQQPLGPTNWTVLYLHGDDEDFEVKDRSAISSHTASASSTDFGAQLRPSTDKLAHACFSQTVSNLQPGHAYTLSGWMKWVGPEEFPNSLQTYRVYFQAIGGQGVARTIDLDNTTRSGTFTLTNTPDADGKIAVQLHLDKYGWCLYDKLPFCNAYFDDFALTY